ncbi:MAG: histidinol-phosphate transaminase [Magnetococcales bacterium]|nr:histidinol-phosphate transaminase [Magnetococcales bacterium]
MSLHKWVRPNVLALAGYVPGEQPSPRQTLIKLNTNENPFPPPEAVLTAIRETSRGDRLRLYPEPSARLVREAAAAAYGLSPEEIVVGNGSDDLLTMILRTFVDPGEGVAAPDPTYTLYAPLTQLQGGRFIPVPWAGGERFELPISALADTGAKVIFLPRPNAPTGHVNSLEEVARLCQAAPGVVVLDEAYGDFAMDNGLPLLPDHDNLIITRSFSKSLSLAGLRIGLGFMSREIATQMHKVRDSYNLDAVAQAAATAALENLSTCEKNTRIIRQERQRLTQNLQERGFQVIPSQANFILTTIPTGKRDGEGWLADLKTHGFLVRYFGSDPNLADKLRITIGTPEEMDRFLGVVDQLLENNQTG